MADCRGRKTNMCKACSNRARSKDPEINERRRQAMLARVADPEFKAAFVARTKEGTRRYLQDPENMRKRREAGRRFGLLGLGMRFPAGHPVRIAAGAKMAATKLSWCPPAYRDLYRSLVKDNAGTTAECRAIVLEEIRRDIAKASTGALMPQPQFIAAREAAAYLKELSNG